VPIRVLLAWARIPCSEYPPLKWSLGSPAGSKALGKEHLLLLQMRVFLTLHTCVCVGGGELVWLKELRDFAKLHSFCLGAVSLTLGGGGYIVIQVLVSRVVLLEGDGIFKVGPCGRPLGH
jgi:hypothetical protein